MSNQPTVMSTETTPLTKASNERKVYAFQCSRAELAAGAVRVGDGLDPWAIIDTAIHDASIEVEFAGGWRAVDIWRGSEWAVLHGVSDGEPMPGALVAHDLLELQVAAYLANAFGEFTTERAAISQIDVDVADAALLRVSGRSVSGDVSRTVIIKTPDGTVGGTAGSGADHITVLPASAVTVWAMIVESLRGEASSLN